MITTALIFFLILSLLVFAHELGHFVVARWVGVKVEEFGFGLPPRIWGKKVKGTIYSLNWLPIGGFVKLAGEDEEESKNSKLQISNSKKGEYFFARSKKERAAILLAGVSMNFLLAVGITTVLLNQGVLEPSGRVHVERTLPGSPAEQSGLLTNDIIVDIGEAAASVLPVSLRKPAELISFVKEHAGSPVSMTVDRGGVRFNLLLTPRVDYPKGEGPMGVAISDLENKSYPWSRAPLVAVQLNLSRARDMVVSIGSMLWRLATLQGLQADVAGPIGIAQVTGQAVKYGFRAVLEFMSILSLNLAVLNVLPIPALDGGRLLFVFLEKFIGKRIKPAFERSTHQIGMIVLLILVVLISINDILRIARGS